MPAKLSTLLEKVRNFKDKENAELIYMFYEFSYCTLMLETLSLTQDNVRNIKALNNSTKLAKNNEYLSFP